MKVSTTMPDRGVLHVLEQGKHQFEFVDKSCVLTPYKLVILPDEARVDCGAGR